MHHWRYIGRQSWATGGRRGLWRLCGVQRGDRLLHEDAWRLIVVAYEALHGVLVWNPSLVDIERRFGNAISDSAYIWDIEDL